MVGCPWRSGACIWPACRASTAGGQDDQTPHTEDEIYAVQSGRATLVTTSGIIDVGPGSVVFVPAGERHKFTDVTEDLALLVVFAPPYGSRTAS